MVSFQGDARKVRGPKAGVVKYAKTLCTTCNTKFSQPFDYAYDRFISWVFEHEEIVIRRRIINFFHVFGEDFATDQVRLYKYFAKSFGCRLVDEHNNVPTDIVDLMQKENFQTGLRITFAVNEHMLKLDEEDRIALSKGGLFSIPHKADVWTFIWRENFEWLSVFYWYNYFVEQELGLPWVADSQYLHLGTYSLLTLEWHSPLIQMVCAGDKSWLDLVNGKLK